MNTSAHPDAQFWIQVNSNFFDICVLDWCKLFAEKKGRHYWGRIFADSENFKEKLLTRLGIDEEAFEAEIKAMLTYRDKFVAHLDELRIMDVPRLEIAKASVIFFLEQLIAIPLQDDRIGVPTSETIARGYQECLDTAMRVFKRASI
jgi:hypothetical protein